MADNTGRIDRDPVIAKVKALKGEKIELTCSDGTVKKVALAKAGNRWSKLVDVLNSVDWHFLEVQDKDGALLGRVDNDDDSDEDEDLGDDHDGGRCPACGRKPEVKVLLEVMRATQRADGQNYKATLEGFAKLVEQMGNANSHLSESYSQSMRLRSAGEAAETAQGSPEFAEMLKMAMMLFAQGQRPSNLPPGGK